MDNFRVTVESASQQDKGANGGHLVLVYLKFENTSANAEPISANYRGTTLDIEYPIHQLNKLPIGHVLFTDVGEALSSIVGTVATSGFIEFVEAYWKQKGLTVKRN